MRNWSTDTTKFKKYSSEYHKWKLEQLVNFGLQGEKINLGQLKANINQLNIDPSKKSFLISILSHATAN